MVGSGLHCSEKISFDFEFKENSYLLGEFLEQFKKVIPTHRRDRLWIPGSHREFGRSLNTT